MPSVIKQRGKAEQDRENEEVRLSRLNVPQHSQLGPTPDRQGEARKSWGKKRGRINLRDIP